jgi:outer membrane receptor for ferrienterochelin and colicins
VARDLGYCQLTAASGGAQTLRESTLTPASGRLDHHSECGTFFSPRVSALLRSRGWTSRLSLGGGFFGPSPLTEETEAAGLSSLIVPTRLQAEQGRSASFDISRSDGPLSYTLTLFGSRIRHPIHVDRSNGLVLMNLQQPATNLGVELLGTFRNEPYTLTATYTYVQAREFEGGILRQAPLTPQHSAGLVGMWERETVGRVGLEFYYTGIQRLEENPFRQISRRWRAGTSMVVFGSGSEAAYNRLRSKIAQAQLIVLAIEHAQLTCPQPRRDRV